MKWLEDEDHFFPADLFKNRTEEKPHDEHAQDVYAGGKSLYGACRAEAFGIFGGDADKHIKHHGIAERSYEAEYKSTGQDGLFVHGRTTNRGDHSLLKENKGYALKQLPRQQPLR